MSAQHTQAPLWASLWVVAAQISVNLGAALGKALFGEVGPLGVVALRTAMSCIMLIALTRPWRLRPDRRQAMWLALYGLVMGCMNVMFYCAIARIPIGIAVTIEICGPLGVVLVTSRSLRDGLWLAMAVGGLMLLAPWPLAGGPGAVGRIDPLGVGFALGAALCWALYILFGKRASQGTGMAAVSIGLMVACGITVPLGVASAGWHLLSPRALTIGGGVAVLSSALPYALEMKALGRLTTRVFGVVTSAAPAIAALTGFAVLGETLSPAQWLAVALMVTASAGSSLSGRAR